MESYPVVQISSKCLGFSDALSVTTFCFSGFEIYGYTISASNAYVYYKVAFFLFCTILFSTSHSLVSQLFYVRSMIIG